MSRLRYIGKRMALSLPVIWLGTTMTWAIIFLGPIDPATRLLSEGQTRDPAAYEAAQTQLGLDQPPLQHYLDWMAHLITFDLGQTWLLYQGSNVNALILDFLPRTLWLGFWSVLIAVFVGVPLGFYAGMHSNTAADYTASMGGIVWRAMPNFWLGIMLLALLGSTQAIFGFDWQSLWIGLDALTGSPDLSRLHTVDGFLAATKKVLPAAIVLGSASMGNEMRIGRTAVLETKNENYVETARAKGVPGRKIVYKHVFRNALIPLVPIITGEAFLLLGGSVLVETVFSINGLGNLFLRATFAADIPVMMSLTFLFIIIQIVFNTLQDLLYTYIDPRIALTDNAE